MSSSGGFSRRGQAEDEAGPALRPVRRPEAAAVVLGDPPGDARPSPRPVSLLLKNGSNSLGRIAGAMPGPVSATRARRARPRGRRSARCPARRRAA